MRLRLRSFLLTSALSFIPSLASATTISGIYVDGGAGYNLVQDQHVHANSPAMSIGGISMPGMALPKFSVNHGTGFTGFGAVGWGFGNGLRVEAEGLYNFSHDSYTDYANTDNTPYINPNDVAVVDKYFPGLTSVTSVPCNKLLGESVEKWLQKTYQAGSWTIPSFQNILKGRYIPPNACYSVDGSQKDINHDLDVANKMANSPDSIITPGIYFNSSKSSAKGLTYTTPSIIVGTRSAAFSQVSHHGTDESYGGFANVIYDFDLERLFGVKSIVTPFIGGGAGYLWQR